MRHFVFAASSSSTTTTRPAAHSRRRAAREPPGVPRRDRRLDATATPQRASSSARALTAVAVVRAPFGCRARRSSIGAREGGGSERDVLRRAAPVSTRGGRGRGPPRRLRPAVHDPGALRPEEEEAVDQDGRARVRAADLGDGPAVLLPPVVLRTLRPAGQRDERDVEGDIDSRVHNVRPGGVRDHDSRRDVLPRGRVLVRHDTGGLASDDDGGEGDFSFPRRTRTRSRGSADDDR
eukprot:10816-Pelagococcus_subviridis.AAC.9